MNSCRENSTQPESELASRAGTTNHTPVCPAAHTALLSALLKNHKHSHLFKVTRPQLGRASASVQDEKPLTHSLRGIIGSMKSLCWLPFPAVRGGVGPVDDCPPSLFLFTGVSMFSAGICNGPRRSLCLSSEEMAPEAKIPCLENGNHVGDKVPVSLCLTAVPWDESIWEALSPKLSTGTAILGAG